jgi:hypothetical protein
MRPRTFVAVILLAGLVSACAGDSPTTPSQTSGSPTLISVTVAGTLSLTLNQTSQFTATAYFAKGTGQNVSAQAAWSSANTTIATVSATGLVTCVGTGTTEIRASYQGVSGSAPVTVTRPVSYVLGGTVTETVPHTTTALAGARVEIVDGPNAGKFATTDAAGAYQIANLSPGTWSMRASLASYDDTTKTVTVTGNTTLNLALNPTLKSTTETFKQQISLTDQPCSGVGARCQVLEIPLHNTGTLDAKLTWDVLLGSHLRLQLYSEDTGTVLVQVDGTTPASLSFSAAVTTPGNYQLRVVALLVTVNTPFTLTTTHTN